MTRIETSSALPVRRGPGRAIAVAAVGAILAAFGIYQIVVSGLALRAAAEQRLQQTIAEEDRAFCGKFGMREGTSEFASCSHELAVIRANQTRQRWSVNLCAKHSNAKAR